MGNEKFFEKCKKIVEAYITERFGISKEKYQVYQVWGCKILQNNKGLFSTTMSDGMYFEITYDGDRCQFYLDAYRKISNTAIGDEVIQ